MDELAEKVIVYVGVVLVVGVLTVLMFMAIAPPTIGPMFD